MKEQKKKYSQRQRRKKYRKKERQKERYCRREKEINEERKIMN